MALVAAMLQLDGDDGVGFGAQDRARPEALQEQGQCRRARDIAAHRGCNSAVDCPQACNAIRSLIGSYMRVLASPGDKTA